MSVGVGEAILNRQAEGGGAPRWLLPTCGTSRGSMQREAAAAGGSRRIQAPLEGTEASQEGSTELPPAVPPSAPGSPGSGGSEGWVQNGPCLEGDSTTKSYGFQKWGNPSGRVTSRGGLVALPVEGGVSGIAAPG